MFLVPPSGSKPAQVAALQRQIKDAEAAATDKDSELARTKKEDIEALQAAQAAPVSKSVLLTIHSVKKCLIDTI